MLNDTIRNIDFLPELKFTASRSGGKGGQHVNKVSTKVELHFDFRNSMLLTDDQKRLIGIRLRAYINKEGILRINASEERSQPANKRNAIAKFYGLLEQAFRKRKKRLVTVPGPGWHKKRLESKKRQSQKKESRRRPHEGS